MSKTTKIIAALGIAAGLGVAALPAFSYADSVAGQVDVDVEVGSAIAMTIVGNNDDNQAYNTGATQAYISVGVLAADTDVTGYYTYDGTSYTAASGTADGTTEYYRLVQGVDVYTPSGATTIDGHQVGTLYDPSNLQTSGSFASMLPNAVVEGGTFKSTITVYTNNASGYTLTMKDADTNTALTKEAGVTIPATSATTLTPGTAAWGYRVGTSGDWLAVPASDAQTPAAINSLNTKTSGGHATTVEYGVATAADQATGIYSDTIIYTATTN